jgi:pimeloyl-ACP methyl ester carboxylesterase
MSMAKRLLVLIVLVLLVPVVLYVAFPEVLFRLAIDGERRWAGLSEGSVLVDDHTVPYLEGGKGETILLVHGFGMNKDNWNRFAKHLTPSFHVVAIDVPGFGESTKREDATYAIAAQADRLNAFVQALSMDSFHVAGSSMGGNISGRYAIRFPDKVLSLGLFNTAGIVQCPEKSEMDRRLEKGDNPLLVETPEDFDATIRFTFVKAPWFPGFVKKMMAGEWIRNRSFNEKVFREIMDQGSSLEPDLEKIEARTLILWGDTDRVLDVSCTEVLKAGLRDSSTVIMKDCGHVPMMERPEETARHYLDFLASR